MTTRTVHIVAWQIPKSCGGFNWYTDINQAAFEFTRQVRIADRLAGKQRYIVGQITMDGVSHDPHILEEQIDLALTSSGIEQLANNIYTNAIAA